jgi:hypothetical protein
MFVDTTETEPHARRTPLHHRPLNASDHFAHGVTKPLRFFDQRYWKLKDGSTLNEACGEARSTREVAEQIATERDPEITARVLLPHQ